MGQIDRCLPSPAKLCGDLASCVWLFGFTLKSWQSVKHNQDPCLLAAGVVVVSSQKVIGHVSSYHHEENLLFHTEQGNALRLSDVMRIFLM